MVGSKVGVGEWGSWREVVVGGGGMTEGRRRRNPKKKNSSTVDTVKLQGTKKTCEVMKEDEARGVASFASC